MRFSPVVRACAVVIALVLSASACAGGEASPGTDASLVDRAKADKKLTVGVKFDEPGIGLKNADGTVTGFDVDVARYVAGRLGVEPAAITFKEARAAEREKLLGSGEVDLVVATYSITDRRKLRVGFAGPYFVAGQSLLIKEGTPGITGPENLNARRMCSVTGSTSATTVKEKYAGQVELREHANNSDCVAALLAGTVDAMTTDDVILAGYAAQNPGVLRLVGEPFTVEYYGIGMKKGDTRAVAAVASAIQQMEEDGSWRKSLETNFGRSGYVIPGPPAITEK